MGLFHFIVKYLLYILNLIFTVFGIAVIVLGVLILKIQFNKPNSNEAINEELVAAVHVISIPIIVLGCIIFVIAFTGCCGAVTETKCLLVTYAVFMFILAAAKIYLAIMWNNEIDLLRDTVTKYIDDAFVNPDYNVTFHAMEASFNCCGTTGPDSYEVLPPTCCGEKEISNIQNVCRIEDAFSIGCVEYINNIIGKWSHVLNIVLIVIIVFESLEFVAAIYLCTSVNKS